MMINDATGLPKLPDEAWWEVRKHMVPSYLYNRTPVQDGYEVCVVSKRVIPARTEQGDRWWKPSRFVPEKVVDKVLFRRHITDPVKFRSWRSEYISEFPASVGKDVIEPADVLKAALDIMDCIEAGDEALKRKEASDALVGAYPPKTLAVRGAE